MFTVVEEAVIDGKLKKEMEQLQICQRVLGSPSLKLLDVIAGHCGHQLNPNGHKFDGVVQFALSQPYWDCEVCASESMESLSLISQGLYPSSNTYFILGKGKQKAREALLA